MSAASAEETIAEIIAVAAALAVENPQAARPTQEAAEETVAAVPATEEAAAEEQPGVGAEDVAICWICAEPIKYYAVSECNHRTCHVCSLRLRALYKKTDLVFIISCCLFFRVRRTLNQQSSSPPPPDALFTSFETDGMPYKDAKLAIYFETQEMMEETLLLLRFNCPDTECDYIGNSWSDLKLHVRATHGRLMWRAACRGRGDADTSCDRVGASDATSGPPFRVRLCASQAMMWSIVWPRLAAGSAGFVESGPRTGLDSRYLVDDGLVRVRLLCFYPPPLVGLSTRAFAQNHSGASLCFGLSSGRAHPGRSSPPAQSGSLVIIDSGRWIRAEQSPRRVDGSIQSPSARATETLGLHLFHPPPQCIRSMRTVTTHFLVDLCIRHKKVFAHEHTLYPPNILPLHLPSMLSHQRNKPAAAGKGKGKSLRPRTSRCLLTIRRSDKGKEIEGGVHPLCEFCRECFFGDDELFGHMRETHEECFVCKRNEIRDQYFLNYAALEVHFTTAHHPCPHDSCRERKFVVFGSALDLQAHLVEEHGGEMGKGGRRAAQRVEAGWDEAGPGRGHGHGRGRGRERDRDRDREREREPPPHPPAQQTQQAQPQPQRPPGGGRRREGFGAALTVEGSDAPPPPVPTPSPPLPRAGAAPAAEVDPAVAAQHTAFLARLASLSPNPTTALPAARAAIRSFRASESSARDLISTLWSVVDQRMESAASIVNALVDLLDEGEQREAVLSAWRGFEVEQRRQFPELVPAAVGSGYAGITSGRVLNAKHATAGRGGRGAAQVWDRVAQAASSSSSLAAPSSAAVDSATPHGRAAARALQRRALPLLRHSCPPPNGGAPGPAPSVTPFSTHMPAAQAQGKAGAPPKLSSALFPELPPSAAARQKAPVSGNVSLRNILGTPAGPAQGAWGAGSSGTSTPNATEPREEEVTPAETGAGGGGGKKKGKGKNKQTLFTIGTFPS
ncbi:E3 ubiquitin-protein ligase hel2 [Mycena venus]|uniref:E3 ubiquitin-protein ligase hel2 n=1 Tax=Mycena venus TaxID=2733690 RepID=A0A8H6XGM6_9AGAR|nr:E3 ubiquitin-protein ligase hel2 [Mycena venus]